MIIDAITRGGDEAYFDFRRNPVDAYCVKTDATFPVMSARIPAETLGSGKAYAISGVSIQLEATDLKPLFQRQQCPLIKLSVQKEMFPSLFAAPYEHRVHNISGYEDFNRGTYADCKAMDIEGVPTIVSLGDNQSCMWTSAVYKMPESIVIDRIAWDLASSRLTPSVSYTYDVNLVYWTDVTLQTPIRYPIVTNANPTDARNVSNLGAPYAPAGTPLEVAAYTINFSAKIQGDSNVYEAHATNPFDTLGAPLLRAVYIVEKIDSPLYEFYSLKELLDHCVHWHLFETPGPQITKLTATLAIGALLVQSDNQRSSSCFRSSDKDNYEYLELTWAQDQFTFVEARASIKETITPPKPTPS